MIFTIRTPSTNELLRFRLSACDQAGPRDLGFSAEDNLAILTSRLMLLRKQPGKVASAGDRNPRIVCILEEDLMCWPDQVSFELRWR